MAANNEYKNRWSEQGAMLLGAEATVKNPFLFWVTALDLIKNMTIRV